jgi:hypothetical protein
MKPKDYWAIIGLIFILSLGLRLFFSFEAELFTGDESYFSMRQIEYITETGLPLIYDPLSYSGRIHIFSPFFYYLLAFFNLFIPITIVGKLIPNVLANCIVFGGFLITKEITKNIKVSLFIAGAITIIPIYVTETVNTITPYSLFFPLLLGIIYCFMKISEGKKYSYTFIVFIIILSFTHIASYLVIAAFVLYFILIRFEQLQSYQEEKEVLLFAFIFVIWSQFIIYKNVFLEYGHNAILQNIPANILTSYFSEVTFFEILIKIGIIPVIFGSYILYRYSFQEKIRNLYIIISFILITIPLIWLKLITVKVSFIFLGIFLTILCGQYLKIFLAYLKKTKFEEYETIALSGFILLFIITSLLSTIVFLKENNANSFSEEEKEAMEWIVDNMPKYTTIAATHEEGNFIAYYSNMTTVLDSNYLMIKNIDTRFIDIEKLFTTKIETKALEIIAEYDISVIYFTSRARNLYNINRLDYTDDKKCFEKVYQKKDIIIFIPTCKVKET